MPFTPVMVALIVTLPALSPVTVFVVVVPVRVAKLTTLVPVTVVTVQFMPVKLVTALGLVSVKFAVPLTPMEVEVVARVGVPRGAALTYTVRFAVLAPTVTVMVVVPV